MANNEKKQTFKYKDGNQEIEIPNQNEKELLIWTVGDLQNNIIPDVNMLREFEKFVKEAMKHLPASIFVPPYVSVKKMYVDKDSKVIVRSANTKIKKAKK